MKKIKNLSVLFVLFSALTLVSCDTEPVDPVLTDNIDPENPGTNPGTDPGTDPGTSEGDYFPLAVNNQWTFMQDGVLNEPIKIIATQTINNKTYYKANQYFEDAGTDQMTGTAVVFFRKDGGNYIERVTAEIPDEEGMSITVSPYEFIMFKDNLEVGQTWTETVTQVTSYDMPDMPVELPDVSTTIAIVGKILAKNVTETVNGETFENIIKVSLKQTISVDGLGGDVPATEVTSEIWFAKNVGPVKSVATGSGLNVTQVLDSYTVN